MSRVYRSLLYMFIVVQMFGLSLCTKPVLLRQEASLDKPNQNLNQHRAPKTVAELHNIDKRETAVIAEDKRLRDFVGKRAQIEPVELQPLTPEQGFSELPIDAVADYEERQPDVHDGNTYIPEEHLFPSPQSSFEESYFLPPYYKRLRDFVGKREEKRLRDFVGKRLRDFVGKRSHILYDDGFTNEKRLRDFVGKRNDFIENSEDEFQPDVSKRLRDFVGKRDLSDNFRFKRAREFVGKRDDISKRLRDFVGKRAEYYPSYLLPRYDKRLRDFVGKREAYEIFDEGKRLRDFVGKRDGDDIFEEDKRLRDFVGKRDDKRAREFVGKRSDKRAREFVGKRDDKRAREFVGKRDDKRAREFVGKRFQFDGDSEEEPLAYKRLRDFVGKRNDFTDFDRPAVGKRLRDFVGRR
ncbi:unnamed protein product [Candidula unifasciata]|uniref:Uncharacterized protein n=1 Tax=Candidula unifasciata TaxID=100452 RepID=A0A8S3Z2G5_9EUPU|nr:unnamed protein product [Candidula unifasciata]